MVVDLYISYISLSQTLTPPYHYLLVVNTFFGGLCSVIAIGQRWPVVFVTKRKSNIYLSI